MDAIVGRFVAHDHFSPCAESQAPLLFAIERDIHGRKPGETYVRPNPGVPRVRLPTPLRRLAYSSARSFAGVFMVGSRWKVMPPVTMPSIP